MTEPENPQGSNPSENPSESSPVPGPTINIGEEFGTAKKAFPPAATIAVTIAAVVLAGIVFAYFQRATPRASGSIESVNTAVSTPDNLVLAAITIRLQNTSGKRLWVKNIRAELQTASGEQSSDAVSAADFPRFFNAFPDLKKNVQPALAPEDAFQPGESVERTILAAFHTTAEEFAQRKSLSVVILPYDEHVEIVLK